MIEVGGVNVRILSEGRKSKVEALHFFNLISQIKKKKKKRLVDSVVSDTCLFY